MCKFKFKKQIEKLFPDYIISNDYLESTKGAWVEFGLMEKDALFTSINLNQLKNLSFVLKTDDIDVIGGHNGSFEKDYIWVTVYGVNFD